MARMKPIYTPDPRVWDIFQVSCRLGKSESWFRQNRAALEGKSFPRFDDFLGGWDAEAIERWLDLRSGIGTGVGGTSDAEWMEA